MGVISKRCLPRPSTSDSCFCCFRRRSSTSAEESSPVPELGLVEEAGFLLHSFRNSSISAVRVINSTASPSSCRNALELMRFRNWLATTPQPVKTPARLCLARESAVLNAPSALDSSSSRRCSEVNNPFTWGSILERFVRLMSVWWPRESRMLSTALQLCMSWSLVGWSKPDIVS